MRVLLVGDMAILWEGLAHVLSTRPEAWSVVRLGSITDALKRLNRSTPDVLLIQSYVRDGPVSDAVAMLRNASQSVKVIVLGVGSGTEEVFLEALEQGASGFVDSTASLEELLLCIQRVADGETYIPHKLAVRLASEYRARSARQPDAAELTGREQEILGLLAQGYSNKAMARELVVSEHTVRSHLRNIMRKLGAENRVQVVARAGREGLLPALQSSAAVPPDTALTA